MIGLGGDSLEATPHELPEAEDAARVDVSGATVESDPELEEGPQFERLADTFSPELAAIEARRSIDVQHVIECAMNGTLSGHRPLREWEPRKLSHIHIQIALLMATGRRPAEITTLVAMDLGRVRQIHAHPLVKRVCQAVLLDMGRQTSDLTARLDRTAPVMLDIIEEITANPDTPSELRAKNAFRWLDIAGYGGNQKHAVEHRVTVDSQSAGLLAKALGESQEIKEASWAYVTDGEAESKRRMPSGGGDGKSSTGSLDQEPAPSFSGDGSASLPADAPTQSADTPMRSSPRLLRAAAHGSREDVA